MASCHQRFSFTKRKFRWIFFSEVTSMEQQKQLNPHKSSAKAVTSWKVTTGWQTTGRLELWRQFLFVKQTPTANCERGMLLLTLTARYLFYYFFHPYTFISGEVWTRLRVCRHISGSVTLYLGHNGALSWMLILACYNAKKTILVHAMFIMLSMLTFIERTQRKTDKAAVSDFAWGWNKPKHQTN